MKLSTIVKASFWLSIANTLLGAYLKITHHSNAELFLITGIVLTMLFIVSAIIEVRSSTRIGFNEKTMWTIAFLFLSGIAGLVYMFLGRKRIVVNA